jgi:signal transduction histidine kinase
MASTFVSFAGLSHDRQVTAATHRTLATGRVVLALLTTFAVAVDLPGAISTTGLVQLLLIIYSIYSIAVLSLIWAAPPTATRLANLIHRVDVVVVAIVALLAAPGLALFPLLVFALITSAFRGGLRPALVSALVIFAGLMLHTLLFSATARSEAAAVLLGVAVLVLALVFGDVADWQQVLRAEAELVARLNALIQAERGLSSSLQAVLASLSQLAGTREAQLLFADTTTGRAYLWKLDSVAPSERSPFHWRELGPAEGRAHLFDLPPSVAIVQAIRRPDGRVSALALDADGQRVPPDELRFDDRLGQTLLTLGAWQTVVCLPVVISDESTARLYLAGAVVPRHSPRELRILMRVVRQVFPALYNLYLLRRLRTRAGELERARVARELHDGVIQSLIGLEMHLDVAKRDAPPELAATLQSIQDGLRQEVLNVRDLMLQMRPLDADRRNLLQIIVDLVERFRRDSGVHTHFVSELDEVDLPPRACRELARIVQEALVNIRRHSGAANAVVRLGARDGSWVLSIDDDGRGFDFAGRLSHEALESSRKGPVVIKERVRTIGGALRIESTPGSGSRLEITIPQRTHG